MVDSGLTPKHSLESSTSFILGDEEPAPEGAGVAFIPTLAGQDFSYTTTCPLGNGGIAKAYEDTDK